MTATMMETLPRSCTQPPARCPLPDSRLLLALVQGEHFDDDDDYGDGGDEGPVYQRPVCLALALACAAA